MSNQQSKPVTSPAVPPQSSAPKSTPDNASVAGNQQTHSIYYRGPDPFQIAERLGITPKIG